jgi:peptidoglycan/LPS O-acetylase OafA/YrhL
MIKSRFGTLDGLRGVAAIAVVLFHAGIIFRAWVPRFGYLAVDLFFILSGFVLSHAYDKRFHAGMNVTEFLYLRVIRLYPLYLLGLVLGLCVVRINPSIMGAPTASVLLNFLLNLFDFPGSEIPGTLYRELFPLNVPLWSLFFEFWVANLIFGICAGGPSKRWLIAFVAVSGAGIFLDEKIYHTMDVGAWPSILGGLMRVAFSFSCGMAISRFRHLAKPATAPSWLFMIGLAVILMGVNLHDRSAQLFELACVLIIFPLMIYFGASAHERYPRVGELLGDASYALYTIHFPLLIFIKWGLARIGLPIGIVTQLLSAAALLPIALGLSWADFYARPKLLFVLKNGKGAADVR